MNYKGKGIKDQRRLPVSKWCILFPDKKCYNCIVMLHITPHMHAYIYFLFSEWNTYNVIINMMYLFHCFLDPWRHCRCFSELEKTMYLIYKSTLRVIFFMWQSWNMKMIMKSLICFHFLSSLLLIFRWPFNSSNKVIAWCSRTRSRRKCPLLYSHEYIKVKLKYLCPV